MPITPGKRLARRIGWAIVAFGAVLIAIGFIYMLW